MNQTKIPHFIISVSLWNHLGAPPCLREHSSVSREQLFVEIVCPDGAKSVINQAPGAGTPHSPCESNVAYLYLEALYWYPMHWIILKTCSCWLFIDIDMARCVQNWKRNGPFVPYSQSSSCWWHGHTLKHVQRNLNKTYWSGSMILYSISNKICTGLCGALFHYRYFVDISQCTHITSISIALKL